MHGPPPFLGMELDSVTLEIRLHKDKLDRLKSLLSSCGKHANRGSYYPWQAHMQSSMVFLRRLIDLSTTSKHLDHFTRLNIDSRSDIEWWFRFAESTMEWSLNDVVLTSDASEKWGCGAFSEISWFQLKWADHMLHHHSKS